MRFLSILSIITLLATGQAFSQPTLPMPSPFATVNQTIGLTKVEVAYSRPSMKDRKIFGELVPLNEMWRTGANKATMIHFEQDVSINGKQVPAGKYSLFTIPGATDWTIVLNTNTELWGTGDYKKDQDQMRFTAKVQKLTSKVETFTIMFANLTENSADLQISWENTLVSFTINADAEKAAWANIDQEIKNMEGSWRIYARSADYAARTGQRLDEAIVWTNKALEMKDYWWTYSVQAEVYAAQKDYKNAVKSLKKGIKLGSETPNWTYKERMEKRLAELEAMK